MSIRTAAYIQAIRGPVLLVTVGILFAIHQAGVLSFSRTWPLLIIVIGIMKLIERAWSPAPASATQTAAYPHQTQAVYGSYAGSTQPHPASSAPRPQAPGGSQV